jgi:predicted outer membrane repeat protein
LQTTVSGSTAQSSGGGIFAEGPIDIQNSSITGNMAGTHGGGIYQQPGVVITLTDTTIDSNTAQTGNGGGLFASGNVDILNSTLSGNAGRDGGGLFNDSGTVIISDSLIESNTATSGGGGIMNDDGIATVRNSNITGNQSAFDGGGIYNESGQFDVFNSTFTNNSSPLGGGIENYLGTVQIVGSTFTGNSGEYGGGVENFEAFTLIQQSTFSGNNADFGGGVDNFFGTLIIEDSVLSNNTAAFSGGGIFTEDAHLEVHQSTVSGNNANDGGGIGAILSTGSVINGTITQNNGGGIAQDSTTFLIQNSIVAGQQTGPDTTGTFAQSSLNNILGIPQGMVLTDVLDPLLMNNGGPTATHAIPQSSPAFNAGNNNFLNGQNFDQRGVGFDRIVGGRVDIGAFENQNLNTLPSIDNIPNQVLTANTVFGPITFGINDAETPANQLSVTPSFLGGDQAIFNDLQISVQGSGAQRNLIFGGTTLLNGSFNMQVEVQDGNGGSAHDDLSVTVQNSSPTITISQSFTLFSRTQNSPESFQVQDAQTPSGQLNVIPSFTQGDQNLFNDLQIGVQGGGNQRDLVFGGITPNTGTFTMELEVFDTDGGFSSALIQVSVVNGAPPNPIIANIDDQESLLGNSPAPIDVIFGDHQSNGNQVDMLVKSDNPSIFRSNDILIGRPGQDEFLQNPAIDQLVRGGLPRDHIQHQQVILPPPLRAGVANITITARDEDGFESEQAFSVFVLTGNFLIIDDGDPGFSTMGSWGPSSAAGAFQDDSLISFETGSKAIFSPNFTDSGTYGVYVRWANQNPNDNSLFERDPSVQVTVNHANGKSLSSINQQQNGERFHLIGIFDFSGNSMENVCLTKISNIFGPVSADAVRFVPFQPALDPGAGDDIIVDVADTGFTSTGNWMPSNAVDAYNGNSLFNTAQGATATFTPNLMEEGKYEVYVHHSTVQGNGKVLSRDPNASYTVNHANGSSQTFINQNFRPNDWLFLGAFDFKKGIEGSVILERTTEDISTPTVADAARLVRIQAIQEPKLIVDNMDPGFSTLGGWYESTRPDTYQQSAKTAFNAEDKATWIPSLTEPGTYDVYAWWSNTIGTLGLLTASRDSTSWYEITHSGGVSIKPIDQNKDNGRWNYIGTFDFIADGTAKVDLNHGRVSGVGISADAIQFVKKAP